MRLSLLFVAILFAGSLNAQFIDGSSTGNASKERFVDRLFFGGILGMQFGSEQTNIEIAPMIGYRVSQRLSAGLNLKYIYFDAHWEGYPPYSTNIYGGGPFARFFVYEGLFAHFEYEILNMEVPNLYGAYQRENISSVFVGGGYRQMLGARSAMDIMLLYNINETKNSPYINPIIHFGFAFGI